MPEIDLPPGKYRWRRPLSLPLAWFFVAVAAVLLVWIYATRSGTTVEFLLTVFVAFCAGGIVAAIFRDID